MSENSISTHVLDTARGKPAAGITVILEAKTGDGWREQGRGRTDTDGRIASLLPGGPTEPGDYRLCFATGDYFLTVGDPVFYPEIVIQVHLTGGKFHLPLLLSPFSYSTYRGS